MSGKSALEILLVEDDEGDVVMTREALVELRSDNRLNVVGDGIEAMQYLRRPTKSRPRPDLILLDLNLPRRGGHEVLEEVKSDDDLRRIPVVILTTSQAEDDIRRSYELHANAYVAKPVDYTEFVEAVAGIDRFYREIVSLCDS
jgi:CheY-like chemotaxis protein